MPFGEEIASGTGGRNSAQGYGGQDSIRQKFTGYERDAETDLDFAQARMYHKNHGRFTSVDPLMASANAEHPQSWNRYSYTFNNPLNFVDPDGRKATPDDYYADRDGEITIDETLDTTDRFYVENEDGSYTLVATLQRNQNGLVQFPDSGTGFNRYGTVDAGGRDPATGENVGQGDHFLQPIVAAALFGVLNVLSSNNDFTVSLGDMSSSNGSDPWQPGSIHHAGHGHNGNRSGLDIDFRYLNNNGESFQSPTARSDPQFSVQNNQTLYDTARSFGFTTNYQGTNRGRNGEIQGVTPAGGHNDHGHLGFNRSDANIFIRTRIVVVPR
jgi:RHS repeat-associated protein